MNLAKLIVIIVITQIFSNSIWILATQFETMDHPFGIIPLFSGIFIASLIVSVIINRWDD